MSMGLLDLIRPSPQLRVMMVTSHADALSEELCSFLAGCEGTMDVSLYPGEHCVPERPQICRVDPIKDFRSPLRTASRDYEAVIVHDVLHRHASPLRLLQMVYRSMENSAQIIIVQPKGSMQGSEVEALCEQSEFRAPNTISDLAEGYDVTVAKKMHMWGNGL